MVIFDDEIHEPQMSSILEGYIYDIFINCRQKDNKYDGWVTGFVDNLKGELESTFEEDISVYFDNNPDDGLLEIHDVDESLKEKLKTIPDEDRYYATLGISYALSGNAEEAIVCGKKAIDLKPVSLDVFQGSIREQELMEIYFLTGNYDLAIEKIEYLLSTPSWISVGLLMVDPLFDNLRNISRFQEIMKSMNSES